MHWPYYLQRRSGVARAYDVKIVIIVLLFLYRFSIVAHKQKLWGLGFPFLSYYLSQSLKKKPVKPLKEMASKGPLEPPDMAPELEELLQVPNNEITIPGAAFGSPISKLIFRTCLLT